MAGKYVLCGEFVNIFFLLDEYLLVSNQLYASMIDIHI